MLDHGNGQLSAVGFFNPWIGEGPVGEFFGSAPAAGDLGPFRITPSETEPAPVGSGGFDIGEGYVQVGGFTILVEGRRDFPTASHEIVAVDVVIDAYGHPSGELVEFDESTSRSTSLSGTRVPTTEVPAAGRPARPS